MARYIELKAVIAEIDERIKDAPINHIGHQRVWAYNDVKDILNTLEAKEVNLKEEVDKIWKPRFSLGWDDKSLLSVSYKGFEVIAKHFFELGLKAEDWEKERMEECPYRQVGCTMYEDKILECRGACSWVVDYPKSKELKAQKGK